MGGSIRFTPLCGPGPDDPVCGLLEFDGCTLLIDCGWDESFDPSVLEPVKRVVPRLDGVLLSHHSISHCGAVPWLTAHAGLTAPIYSTLPVHRMGQLALEDVLDARKAVGEFGAFSASDLAQAFDPMRWVLTRYYQRIDIPGGDGGPGVHVTPYASGRLVGGCVWRIVSGTSGEEVVYAVDWGHKREAHLNGTRLGELFTRPAAMICDGMDALAAPVDAVRRNSDLLDLILATLRGSDGCVLIPTDSAGRVLELALTLDEIWAREKFDRVYPLVLISDVARAVAEAAQSQLEWMSDSVGKAFGMRRDNPFNFRCVRTLSSPRHLAQLQAGPKVVLASHPSLECGAARELFLQWAGDAKNTIIFTQRAPVGTLADTLLRHVAGPEPLSLTLSVSKRVPLEGAELEAWEAGKQEGGEAAEGSQGMEMDGPSGGSPQHGPGSSDGAAVAHVAGGAPSGTPARVQQHQATGSLPLRTSSASITTLVRNATGVVVQTLSPAASLHAPGTCGSVVHQLPPSGRSGQVAGPGAAGVKQEGGGLVGPMAVVVAGAQQQGSQTGAGSLADVLMDGFVPPQGAAHPMFPDEDDLYGPGPEEWDDYGVKLKPGEFKQTLSIGLTGIGGSLGARGAKGPRGRGAAARGVKKEERGQGSSKTELGVKEEDDEDDERRGLVEEEEGDGADEDRPTKVFTEQVPVTVRAAVRYFNFEGRSDAKYVRKVLSDIAPRALVVLRGTPAARSELASAAERDLGGLGTRIALPGAGEQVDISAPDAHALHMSNALAAKAVPHTLGGAGYQVALVDAVVGPADVHNPGLLQLLPASAAGLQGGDDMDFDMGGDGGQWMGDVFFADGAEGVRLSEVKKALADAGIASAFLGLSSLQLAGPSGPLPVIITKAAGQSGGRGHLVVEAAMCEAHEELLQRVRAVIYTQYSVAA